MTQVMNRRTLFLTAGAAALSACGPQAASASERQYANSPFRGVTDAQWRERLPRASYDVLRHEGTERSGTSPLNGEHRAGTYICRGCGLPLFRSAWKFDSHTGWPSFYSVIASGVGTRTDLTLGFARTEYHCARCLGHQGHVFDDGPPPTGKRYCNNGVALSFQPA